MHNFEQQQKQDNFLEKNQLLTSKYKQTEINKNIIWNNLAVGS